LSYTYKKTPKSKTNDSQKEPDTIKKNSQIHPLIHLSETIGNRAMQRLVKSDRFGVLQKKKTEMITSNSITSPIQNVVQFVLKKHPTGKTETSDVDHDTVTTTLPAENGRPVVTGEEGKKMVANNLGPDTVGGGSPTNDGVRAISREMTVRTGRRYVAGHLLNSNLGGSGTDTENITAFSSKSNSQHLHYTEKYIKRLVKAGHYINYTVDTVRDPTSNLATSMTTKWQRLNDDDTPEDGGHIAHFNLENYTAAHGTGTLTENINKDSTIIATQYVLSVLQKDPTLKPYASEILNIFKYADYDEDGKLVDSTDVWDELDELGFDNSEIKTILSYIPQ